VRWWSGAADDPVEIAGLRFANRIGLAGGMDKDGCAPLAWRAFGFGFLELGTVTPKPQLGNPKPRMFRYPSQSALVNRMGFNNAGAEALARRLARQRHAGRRPPIPVGVSIGKNKDTPEERAAEGYFAAAAAVAAEADFLSINISSPNTEGLRNLQTASSVATLLAVVQRAAPGKPVFVKFAPEVATETLVELLDACVAGGAAGAIAGNTRKVGPSDGYETGGLSGRPLRAATVTRVRDIRAHIRDRLAIVGCGGVDDAASAQALLAAGADLVQIYTGLVYRGPWLPAQLSRALAGRR
jgi:dihydroorotate dehydrogenase